MQEQPATLISPWAATPVVVTAATAIVRRIEIFIILFYQGTENKHATCADVMQQLTCGAGVPSFLDIHMLPWVVDNCSPCGPWWWVVGGLLFHWVSCVVSPRVKNKAGQLSHKFNMQSPSIGGRGGS